MAPGALVQQHGMQHPRRLSWAILARLAAHRYKPKGHKGRGQEDCDSCRKKLLKNNHHINNRLTPMNYEISDNTLQ